MDMKDERIVFRGTLDDARRGVEIIVREALMMKKNQNVQDEKKSADVSDSDILPPL